MSEPLRLVLLTRPDCHLCDRMESVIADVLGEDGAIVERVDVDSDPRLQRLYGETIPVLLLDDREVARVRTSPRGLRRRLGELL